MTILTFPASTPLGSGGQSGTTITAQGGGAKIIINDCDLNDFDDISSEEVRKTTLGFHMEAYLNVQQALDFAKRKLNYSMIHGDIETLNPKGLLARVKALEETLEYMKDEIPEGEYAEYVDETGSIESDDDKKLIGS